MSEPRDLYDPVDAFRRQSSGSSSKTKEPLALHGKLILFSLTLQIIFLGWSMGGLRVWSVVTLFALNAIGFFLLFIPVSKQDPKLESSPGPTSHFKKLLTWPFFWLGLLFLLYIVAQNLNPAWEYTLSEDGNQWWLTGIQHIEGAPTGIVGPFDKMNGWRALMIFASGLMLVSVVWCGVTRREHLIYLLWVTVFSTTTMALIGLIQRFTHTQEMLWFIEKIPRYYFGTFTYKNHAGAFIGLNIAIALGLAAYYFRQSRRKFTKSSPYFFFLTLALVMATGVFYTNSRASIIVMACVSAFSFALFIYELLSYRTGYGTPWLSLSLTAITVAFAALLFSFLNIDHLEKRLKEVFDDMGHLEEGSLEEFSHSAKQRYHIYLATWEMVEDNRLWGWGAGGYRYYFPVYQQKYPEIHYFERMRWRRDNQTKERIKELQRYYWGVDYAHNDWLQYPAEIGFVGCGIGLLGCASLALSCISRWRRIRVWMVMCMIGCLGTLLHAFVDFVFQCPSILLLWILLPVIIVRYLHLSDRIMERRKQQLCQAEDEPRRLSLRPEAAD